jgi:hypothetical protein
VVCPGVAEGADGGEDAIVAVAVGGVAVFSEKVCEGGGGACEDEVGEDTGCDLSVWLNSEVVGKGKIYRSATSMPAVIPAVVYFPRMESCKRVEVMLNWAKAYFSAVGPSFKPATARKTRASLRLLPSMTGILGHLPDSMFGRTSVVEVRSSLTGGNPSDSFSMYALMSAAGIVRRHAIPEHLKLSRTRLKLSRPLPGIRPCSDCRIADENGTGLGGFARSCFTDSPPADSP